MNYIRQSGLFLPLTFLFCIASLGCIVATDKGTLYLALNAHSSLGLDFFFKWVTHLGDGLFFVAVAILLSFRKIQWFVLFILCYLSSGVLVQLIKKFLFPGNQRPARYFEDLDALHLVEGVDVHHYQSFPSGHTASAFAFFLLVSLIINNRPLSVLFFIAALSVGISRIYLSLHFLEDVVGGTILGVAVTLVCHKFVLNNAWFNRNAWMQLSVQKAFKRRHEA